MLEYRMQQLKETNKKLTITDVRTELNLRYERLQASKPVQKQVEYAYYMGTKFKGKCHWCGKIGHKSSECRLRISGKPKANTQEKGKENENNSSTKVNRKNLFCTFCKIKGHDVSECRKKKRQENQDNGGNNFKEVACMATDGKINDDNLPSFGRCTQCQRWGPTFEYCTVCGEDTGMIYFPTTLNPSEEEELDEDIMREIEEEERQAKILVESGRIEKFLPYACFMDVPNLIVPPREDKCAEIPIKKMFEFVHTKTDVGHCLYYETMRDYVDD